MLLPLSRPIELQIEERPKILEQGPINLIVPERVMLVTRERITLVLPADIDLELLR